MSVSVSLCVSLDLSLGSCLCICLCSHSSPAAPSASFHISVGPSLYTSCPMRGVNGSQQGGPPAKGPCLPTCCRVEPDIEYPLPWPPPPNTGNVCAGELCPPRGSGSEYACGCGCLYRAWGTAWWWVLGLGPAGAAVLGGAAGADPPPHNPRSVLRSGSPCQAWQPSRFDPEGVAGGPVPPEVGNMVSSWSDTAIATLCPR